MVNVQYNKLGFYKKSYDLSLLIYKIEFPKHELYGLQSQIRRCATSVPLNVAEGTGRSTMKDFKSFLYNALGSCRELEVLLKLAFDLNYIKLETYTHLNKELYEVTGKLINYMKTINP